MSDTPLVSIRMTRPQQTSYDQIRTRRNPMMKLIPEAPPKEKLVYIPPRLESHPAWRVTTAQIGSFPSTVSLPSEVKR